MPRHIRFGSTFNDHIEGDGAEIFAHACKLGFEGIVSKDRASSYRSGPSKTWVKIKNLQAPGVLRFEDRDAPARSRVATAAMVWFTPFSAVMTGE